MRKYLYLTLLLALALQFLPRNSHAADVTVFSSAIVDYNTLGDKTLVAATAGKSVRVYRILIYCNGANDIIFADTTGATIIPVINLAAGQGIVLDAYSPTIPWILTPVGTGLVLNLSANQQCSGRIYYTKD